MFADAVALVLGDYQADIVRMAVDPRTGIIEQFPMGLPNVGQIKQYLNDLLARQDRIAHYQALPKFVPGRPQAIKAEPNLFVPSDHRRYAEMLKKRGEDSANRSVLGSHVCADKVARNGIWVPLNWVEVAHAASA